MARADSCREERPSRSDGSAPCSETHGSADQRDWLRIDASEERTALLQAEHQAVGNLYGYGPISPLQEEPFELVNLMVDRADLPAGDEAVEGVETTEEVGCRVVWNTRFLQQCLFVEETETGVRESRATAGGRLCCRRGGQRYGQARAQGRNDKLEVQVAHAVMGRRESGHVVVSRGHRVPSGRHDAPAIQHPFVGHNGIEHGSVLVVDLGLIDIQWDGERWVFGEGLEQHEERAGILADRAIGCG